METFRESLRCGRRPSADADGQRRTAGATSQQEPRRCGRHTNVPSTLSGGLVEPVRRRSGTDSQNQTRTPAPSPAPRPDPSPVRPVAHSPTGPYHPLEVCVAHRHQPAHPPPGPDVPPLPLSRAGPFVSLLVLCPRRSPVPGRLHPVACVGATISADEK